ncbi:hypothetical protein GGI1_17888 [Acidithiobacillus sp. GGI-221]|nr:hypothetical protein GGI1_17888 [Acidithiobacillus sp. GGI-221]
MKPYGIDRTDQVPQTQQAQQPLGLARKEHGQDDTYGEVLMTYSQIMGPSLICTSRYPATFHARAGPLV